MVSGRLRSVNNLDVNFAATVSSTFPCTEFRHQATMTSESTDNRRKPFLSFLTGAVIGVLGGLIGLGGAEFRLPVLLTVFGYATLPAVIVNLVVSLVTVVFSFIFRLNTTGLDVIASNLSVVVNILAGSLISSYFGARLATHIGAHALRHMVVVLLVMLSLLLMSHELMPDTGIGPLNPLLRVVLGFLSGVAIGAVSSLLGVAGGELIIPTIVLLFAIDIKLAGSLSLAISAPTILMGLYRYQRQRQLADIIKDRTFIIWMAAGSICGSLAGSYSLRHVADFYLHCFLGAILLVSATKIATYTRAKYIDNVNRPSNATGTFLNP
jgi:uncharacterized protein